MVKKILSLVLNSIAVIAGIIGLVVIRQYGALVYVKFFTVLTNCMIIISGFISIGLSVDFLLRKDKDNFTLNPFVYVLKLITAVSALITFLTVVCYLQYLPASGGGLLDAKGDDLVNNICHHYVAPLAFILGFILFDVDRKYNVKLAFGGIGLLVIYMCYMVPICIIDNSIVQGAPYPFMDTSKIAVWLIPLLCIAFLVAGLGISFILWTLNRICFYIFTGEEVSKDEINAEDTASDKETEKAIQEEIKEEEKLVEETGYKGPRIYHISKRKEDSMWQVKFANGKKAIRLFNTQAEAIVFAKKLAKSQDGSIRVHSLKGRIRKSN